jgi:GT2 family glycosyltransferase
VLLSVVIPSRNGGAILARHLPQVAAEVGGVLGEAEVLVVDDASDAAGDRTGATVKESAPTARLLRVDHHGGFGGTCNLGARAARGDLVLFLNNDMELAPGCVATLIEAFNALAHPFAVVPVIENRREAFPESMVRLRWHRGVFDVVQPGRGGATAATAGATRAVAYPCGGAFLTRRDLFLAFGGFAGLYAPFYWEDADLGWRAWYAGRGCFEVGGATVFHEHAATIGSSYPRDTIRALYERNRLLFTWAHLGGTAAWAEHLALLPVRFVAARLRNDPAWRGLSLAVPRWREARAQGSRHRAAGAAERRHFAAVRAAGAGGWPP